MATAITAVFIAAVILINIVSSLLIERFDITIDTTSNKVYNISTETEDFLQNFSETTKIYVMAKESDFKNNSEYYAHAYHILEKIASTSDNITTEYVDFTENPQFSTQYPNVTLAEASVLIVGENGRYTALGSSDLFQTTYDYSTYQISEVISTAEQSIVSALEYIEGANPTGVAVITGHGEEDFSSVSSILETSSYNFEDVTLLSENIPDTADMVLICSPTADFSDDEIAKLEDFLDNNGNLGTSLIYIANATQVQLPNLEAFLESWGVEINEGLVYELNSSYYYQSQLSPFNSPESNDFTANMTESSLALPVLVPYLKPMAAIEADGITTTTIGSTSSSSVLVPADAAEDWQPTQDDLQSFPYALAGVMYADDSDTESASSKVIAFASIDMFSYMSESNLSNGDLITSVFSVAANKESSIQIASKSLTSSMLGISTLQSTILLVIFMIMIPIGTLVTGLVIWMRRRNR